MADRGFEPFEHTADVGIRAWGPTLDVAFEEAALGLVAQMVDASQAKRVGEARIEVAADSIERLLYAFLDEVLFLVQTKLHVVARIEVRIAGNALAARVEGEAYDPHRHGHLHEVKAITYHDLVVQREPPEVRVIVDI